MPVIKLYANLRQLAGIKETTLPGESLRAVLHELVERYPALGKTLFKNGQMRPHVIVTVNGQTMVDLDTPVREQDQIAVFPPIAGG